MQAKAFISQSALQHNIAQAKNFAPQSKIVAMVKANAYGHHIEHIEPLLTQADLLAVSELFEVKRLRQFSDKPILLLSGVYSAKELDQAQQLDCIVVLHAIEQLPIIANSRQKLTIWIKVDTGMHRLGLTPKQYQQAVETLAQSPHINIQVVMSHFACADETDHPMNAQQLEVFNQLEIHAKKSMANSAMLMSNPGTHFDYVRPGIMLYGVSPFAMPDAQLKAAMQLQAPVLAVRQLEAGEAVGYGATFVADKPTTLATIGIGYGDGYPRHMKNGAPVSIAGKLCQLAGRVSMDLITVDVGNASVNIGDQATLWGDNNTPVELLAQYADTTAYELITGVSARVNFSSAP